ncbi:unnamed protein product [Urochloa humidicola]
MAMGAEEDSGGLEVKELIHGQSDDAAMECLARVPSWLHRRMRRGCVKPTEFRRRRWSAGPAEDNVFGVPCPGHALLRRWKGVTPECGKAEANLTSSYLRGSGGGSHRRRRRRGHRRWLAVPVGCLFIDSIQSAKEIRAKSSAQVFRERKAKGNS